MLECKTYRFYDHVGIRGMGVSYRTDEEVLAWRERDAITGLEKRMVEMGVATAEELEAVHTRIRQEALDAIKYAEESPFPDESELLTDVYYVKA